MIRLIALLCLLALPVRAEIAELTLLPGWRDGSRHVAGLQIALQPGWKTYWRSPGDAGIPPRFNWSGSSNLADVRVAWPTPHVFSQAGMRSVGYNSGVVLPLIVTPRDPSKPVELRLGVDIGVCRDVCVPVSAALDGVLPAEPVRADARIRSALADRPLSKGESGAGDMTCRVTPGGEGATVTADLRLQDTGGAEHAVIELSDPRMWVSSPEISRRGDDLSVTARVRPPRGIPLAIDRRSLRLTVLGRRGAVEIVGCD